jgi:hypothetical protein
MMSGNAPCASSRCTQGALLLVRGNEDKALPALLILLLVLVPGVIALSVVGRGR